MRQSCLSLLCIICLVVLQIAQHAYHLLDLIGCIFGQAGLDTYTISLPQQINYRHDKQNHIGAYSAGLDQNGAR